MTSKLLLVSVLQWRKLVEMVALSLQSLKDFADNHYVLLGCGAVMGATALFALYGSKCPRKKRPMSSYPNLRDNKTTMDRFLTPEIFSKVKDKRSAKGYDIDKLIESGLRDTVATDMHKMAAGETLVENSIRLLAGNEECYDLFRELIDPVIREVHQIYRMENLRSEVNLNWEEITGGNFHGANVVSCGLSTSRNIQGHSMIPGCSSAELLHFGHMVVQTLNSVEGKECYEMVTCY